jgi:hypothetical protein
MINPLKMDIIPYIAEIISLLIGGDNSQDNGKEKNRSF